MGMFDMSETTGLKDAGKVLTAGIHNAKFKGVTLSTVTSQEKGQTWNVMSLKLDIDDYGEFESSFFEPTSDERKEGNYGLQPSPADHFKVALRQIFDALDPEIGKSIDEKNVTVGGKHVDLAKVDTFEKLVKMAKALTDPYIDAEVEVKLIPGNKGYVGLPGFPARINRAGLLGIATRFIGHDLTLSQSEQKKIAAAANSRPTNMTTAAPSETLNGVADALGVTTSDDLPF